jgi:lipid-A-disaccharide synthase
VNLIAGRAIVRELIQDDFTQQACARELARLLGSPEACQELRRSLSEVREKLGPPGAIERAAEEIVALLRKADS